MDATTLARVLGAGRIAFGAGLVAVPGAAAARWIGEDAERPGTQVMCVAMGARDAAIGAGLLMHAGGDGARSWIVAGVASDAADLVATLGAEGIPMAGRLGVGAIAAGAIAAGIWLLTQDA